MLLLDSSRKNLELNESMGRFWDLESIGIKDNCKTLDDDIVLEKFNNSIQVVDGRYEVSWPFKEENPSLPENFELSKGRLKSLLKRLSQRPDLYQKYNEIIQKQIQQGILERVVAGIQEGPKRHYICHHGAETPEKLTTPLRIVNDASAKASKDGKSLNDVLYSGPNLIPDLAGILLRFRLGKIAVISDIEKAFLQLQLKVPDRDYARILWLKDPTKY